MLGHNHTQHKMRQTLAPVPRITAEAMSYYRLVCCGHDSGIASSDVTF